MGRPDRHTFPLFRNFPQLNKMKTKIIVFLSTTIMMAILPIKRPFAQQDSTLYMDSTLETWETLIDELEDAENMTEDLLERLEESRSSDRPNLNDLKYETAVNLLKLTDYQYYQLQLYIETYGPLYSIYEIPSIDGFSVEEMRWLAARTIIAPPPKRRPTFRELIRSCKNVFWVRYGQIVERQAGYDTTRANHYNGSPAHLQFHYDSASGSTSDSEWRVRKTQGRHSSAATRNRASTTIRGPSMLRTYAGSSVPF